MPTPPPKDLSIEDWARARVNQVVIRAIYDCIEDPAAKEAFLQNLRQKLLPGKQPPQDKDPV